MTRSKLSFHISSFANDKIYDWVHSSQPTTIKVLGSAGDASEMNLKRLHDAAPGALLVYRHYKDGSFQNYSPTAFFAEMGDFLSKVQKVGLQLVLEGPNEQDQFIHSPDDAIAYSNWQTTAAGIAHGWGHKYAAYSFATGNPDPQFYQYYVAGIQAADYLAVHEYVAPPDNYTMIGRYADLLAALGNPNVPVLVTETSLDDGHNLGWQGLQWSAGDFMALLTKIDSIYAADPRVLGAMIYQWGDGSKNWKGFSTDPIMPALAAYIATASPVPAIPPPAPAPAPAPAPVPAYVQGIDVSHYQGGIMWNQVQQTVKRFIFIKATEGAQIVDSNFYSDMTGAKQIGLLRSPYHFYRFADTPDAQFKNFSMTLGGEWGELPVMVDVEDDKTVGNWQDLNLFCQMIVNKTGREPIIYTRKSYWDSAQMGPIFVWPRQSPLAVATYGPAPVLPSDWKDWTFWQYSDKGSVLGINGDVDLQYFNGTLDQLKALATPPDTNTKGDPPPTPDPTPAPQPQPGIQFPYPKHPALAHINPIGVHFVLDNNPDTVDHFIPYLQRMHIGLVTVYGGDELQVTNTASKIKQATGAFTILRPEARPGHDKTPDWWQKLAALAISKGVDPYIQIYNEPEIEGPGPKQFANKWIANARAVIAGGGYPVLQVLSPEYFHAVCQGLDPAILERLVLCVHNYGANHPPAYPYDDVEQHGTQVDQAYYDAHQWNDTLANVNSLRSHSAVPGQTITGDGTAVLRFLEMAEWAKADFAGYVPPTIAGEGGWEYQNGDDRRYPKVTADLWVDYHKALYGMFVSRTMPNGQPLPDYFVGECGWLLNNKGGWQYDSWVEGPDADKKKPFIDYLASLQPIERWGQAPAPQPQPSEGGVEGTPAPTPGDNSTGGSPAPAPQPAPMPSPVPHDPLFVVEPANSPARPWLYVKTQQGTQAICYGVLYYDNQPVDNPASDNAPLITVVVKSHDTNELLSGVKVTQIWPGGSADEYTIAGVVNFNMSGDSSFDPNKSTNGGPYIIQVADLQIKDLGLPLKQHVRFVLLVALLGPLPSTVPV